MPLTFIIPTAVAAILIVFWLWMFYEMINNSDIPGTELGGIHWPPQTKNHWVFFFLLLNIYTAGYYYFTVYRDQ